MARVRFCHPLLSRQDLMQEALIGAWLASRRLDSTHSDEEKHAFMTVRAEGAVRDALRAARRLDGYRRDGTSSLSELRPMPASEDDPSTCPLGALVVKRALEALQKKLSPQAQHVAVRLAEGAVLADIGRELGFSESRAWQLAETARRGFEKLLQP